MVLVSRVDHEQEPSLLERIDKHVVDDPARLIAEQRVLNSAGAQLAEVASHDALRERPVADAQLTHMRQIKESNRFTHGSMLLSNAAVLQGHGPAAERNQLRTQARWFLMERRPLSSHHAFRSWATPRGDP